MIEREYYHHSNFPNHLLHHKHIHIHVHIIRGNFASAMAGLNCQSRCMQFTFYVTWHADTHTEAKDFGWLWDLYAVNYGDVDVEIRICTY